MIHVFEKMSGLCLYMRVCVCVVFVELLCECLLSQPHAPSLQKTTCLSNPTADETLEEKRSGRGGERGVRSEERGGAVKRARLEKFTVTDGR